MAERDRRRARRPLGKTLLVLVVLALVAGGAVAWRTGWAEDRWDDWRAGDAVAETDPAAVAAPEELELPDVVPPSEVAPAADAATTLDEAAVRRALRGLGDRDLGRHVLAAVAPLEGGRAAVARREGQPLAIPASTTKVVTSTVALFTLGADHVFTTSTVLADGAVPTLTLVGGGDPFLAAAPPTIAEDSGSATVVPDRADLTSLAARTARALRADGDRRVRLAYDDSLFTGPAFNPTWEPGYAGDVVSPITALWVDEGRAASGYGRVADPSGTAAAVFADALRGRGIKVVGAPRAATAGPGAAPVAEVTSAPLAQIVERVLEVSDNEASEVLLRHIGLAQGGEGSFAAGQAGVTAVLTAHGIDMAGSILYDGSGLSRDNRMAPGLLVDVLRFAARDDQPELWPVLSGLPVAGFTGSLTDRLAEAGADPDGLGRVRAKTGTLTGVTSLAGTATDADGDVLVFVLMADRVPKDKDLPARVAMDNVAAALAACDCAGG